MLSEGDPTFSQYRHESGVTVDHRSGLILIPINIHRGLARLNNRRLVPELTVVPSGPPALHDGATAHGDVPIVGRAWGVGRRRDGVRRVFHVGRMTATNVPTITGTASTKE